MNFNAVSDLIREAERQAALAGVPAAKAAEILIRAEAELTMALAESQRAERQLLLDLQQRGAREVARARGVSRAQVYVLRSRALNKLSRTAVPA